MPSSGTPPKALRRTPQEFQRLLETFEQRLQVDPLFAEFVQMLCRTPERVRCFTTPSGCSISTFASLMDLPASTVRHYQRLGLITPYEVNGKFRFWLHNVVQVESVRQWRDLGLSLEEIQAQQAQGRLGGQTATFNVSLPHLTLSEVTSKSFSTGFLTPQNVGDLDSSANSVGSSTVWLPFGSEQMQVSLTFREAFPENGATTEMGLDSTRLRAEVRAARQRLERRLLSLEAQVSRARRLEAALEP